MLKALLSLKEEFTSSDVALSEYINAVAGLRVYVLNYLMDASISEGYPHAHAFSSKTEVNNFMDELMAVAPENIFISMFVEQVNIYLMKFHNSLFFFQQQKLS